MDELRKQLERVRKSCPYNDHAKAVLDCCTTLAGVVEAQAAQIAELTDAVAKLTPPE